PCCLCLVWRAPASTLFPYTTLFRSATLVVSGGRSPVPFFEALAQQALPWAQVLVSLADERWVPVNHAGSNEALVRRHLLRGAARSEEHTSELQSRENLVCRLLLEKK